MVQMKRGSCDLLEVDQEHHWRVIASAARAGYMRVDECAYRLLIADLINENIRSVFL